MIDKIKKELNDKIIEMIFPKIYTTYKEVLEGIYNRYIERENISENSHNDIIEKIKSEYYKNILKSKNIENYILKTNQEITSSYEAHNSIFIVRSDFNVIVKLLLEKNEINDLIKEYVDKLNKIFEELKRNKKNEKGEEKEEEKEKEIEEEKEKEKEIGEEKEENENIADKDNEGNFDGVVKKKRGRPRKK